MHEEVIRRELVESFINSFGDIHLKNASFLAFKNNEVIDMLIIDAKIKNVTGVIDASVFKIISEPSDYILVNLIINDKSRKYDIIHEIFTNIPFIDGIKVMDDKLLWLFVFS